MVFLVYVVKYLTVTEENRVRAPKTPYLPGRLEAGRFTLTEETLVRPQPGQQCADSLAVKHLPDTQTTGGSNPSQHTFMSVA